MAFTTSTFAPQIEYEKSAFFNFATNKFYLESSPSESLNMLWDNVEIPNQDGGDSHGGELAPRVITLQFQLITYSPQDQHTYLEALKTALRGRAVADEDWSAGHFRLYYHRDGSTVLYLEEVVCMDLKIGRRVDQLYRKDGKIYTVVSITFRANNPEWQTRAASVPSTVTASGGFYIDIPEGYNAIEIYNTTESELKAVIDSSGNIKLMGEVQENQSSVS